MSLDNFEKVCIQRAQILHNIGILYGYKGDLDKALKFYTQSLDISDQIYGKYNSQSAETLNKIGSIYLKKGYPD